MRVLFLKDVQGVAQAGDIKEVAGGFARNYLIPQAMATLATEEQLKRKEKIVKAAEGLRLKELQDMEALAHQLNGVTVTLKAKISPGGGYYGAITDSHVAEELGKMTERKIERRLVELEQPIQEPGEYTASLKLHPDVNATINVVAEGEE
jgi:large subunit ribosomal protein L9